MWKYLESLIGIDLLPLPSPKRFVGAPIWGSKIRMLREER